jgi:hypothetical protein
LVSCLIKYVLMTVNFRKSVTWKRLPPEAYNEGPALAISAPWAKLVLPPPIHIGNVCSAISKERVCNSCAMCNLHTISLGTTQPSIYEHESQLS